MAGATGKIKTLLHTSWGKLGAAIAAFIALLGSYDVLCNQFGFPPLRILIGMSEPLMPWWGWVSLLGAVLCLLWVVRAFVSGAWRQQKASAAALSVVVLVLGACAVWSYVIHMPPPLPPAPVAPELIVQCDSAPAPDAMPVDGVSVFQITGIDSLGMVTWFGQTGRAEEWPHVATVRCTVINYTAKPMIGPILSIGVRLRSAIRNASGLKIGDTVARRNWLTGPPRIDPGTDRPFRFWLLNTSPLFAEISLPSTATYRTFDSDEQKEATIRATSGDTVLLPPLPTGAIPVPPSPLGTEPKTPL